MKKIPKKTLVIDISSLLFRVAAVQKVKNQWNLDLDPEDLVGLCMHVSLQSIMKWFNKIKPEFIVFAFEGGNNWRKTYTTNNSSRKDYKGNRTVDPSMKYFYQMLASFYETIKSHTSICCLKVPETEADDSIAGYCQLYASDEHEISIVSSDKDFIQLLKLPGVKLINPENGKLRNSVGDKDYEPDLDYWLFLKCVRGDTGDHVPSAFPNVRETKVRKAYDNDFDRVNFMNATWVDPFNVTHKVGELFEENKKLLSLFDQPEDIKVKLFEGVSEQTESLGKYSHFHFLRFVEEYKLQRIREDSMKFVDLFCLNQRFLKGEVEAPKVRTVVKQTDEPMEEITLRSSASKSIIQY